MRRLFFLLAAIFLTIASPASAADRCRPRTDERTLARSAQAVVLARLDRQAQPFPRQTLTGCSRASGRRRVMDTIERGHTFETENHPSKLVGLRMAGTRVAYLAKRPDGDSVLLADDALHGGRRHNLSAEPQWGTRWPFSQMRHDTPDTRIAWAVDAQGDVAWLINEKSLPSAPGNQSLGVWRPGLGRRQLDAHAVLVGPALRDGIVRWRRGGAPRAVDLTKIPPSRCTGGDATTTGTLEMDITPSRSVRPFTACLRATGQTLSAGIFGYEPWVTDVNGPHVVLQSFHTSVNFAIVLDVARGTTEEILGPDGDMVVDNHGSLAWIDDGLWISDADGRRRVADVNPAAPYGPLLRDGSTVTWSGGGPTVTLNP